MPPNVGPLDRFVRIVVGATLAIVVPAAATDWRAAGFYLLLTGLAARCPLYRVLGVDTRGKGPAK